VPDPRHGVFETLLVIDGHPIELDAHLVRLEASLEALFPNLPLPRLDVPGVTGPYASSTPGTSASALRIAIGPGAGGELEMTIERRHAPAAGVVSLRGLRVPGGLGAHKWVDRSLLDVAQAALPADSLPLLVDEEGSVLEASRANVFAVREGRLITPPTDGRILPGVTRMRVLEIAAAMGIETNETVLATDDLLSADEVFLSGSVRGIEPVDALDGIALSTGGEVGSTIAAELWESWKPVQVG
jgi:para-aminobenzoate synthetase/4-amino-4-deoxychorismate lyase